DGFSDTDVFAVQVTDGTATVPTTLTLNITGQNDAPTVVNDALVAPVNGSANGNVLANDSDVDSGDSLTVSLAGGVAPGTSFVATSVGGRDGIATVQANGDITFNTNGNFVDLGGGAQDTVIINYTASDGTDTSVGQVVITVTGINDAPIAVDDSDSTDEDTAVTLAVLTNDSDPENDPITITMVDGQAIAPGGSVVLSGSGATVTLNVNGTLTYDPSGAFDHLADGAPGADSFSYTISDPDGETDTATVSIALTGVNDAPVAGDDSLDVFEGIGINISATGTGNLISAASDVDGTVTSVVEVDGVTDGTTGIAGLYGTLTWDALTGAYLYTVNDSDPTVHGLTAGSSLSETFDFIVQDDFGANSNTATLTVTINGVTDGLFTEQADTVDLSAAIQAFPQTAFENNFLNALGGDDTVVLVSGLEVSPYLSQFNGQTFSGDGGSDWITILNGNMNADGGTGRDTLDTSALLATTSAVRVDLGAGTVDIGRNNTTDLTAINFEDVIGTAFADELISSAADNGIYAGAGNDIIRVRAGTTSLGDIYVGGAGTDSLINNSGSNLVFNSFDVTDLTGTVNGSGIETINTGILTILGTTGDDYQNYNGTRFLAVSTTASLFEVSTGDGNDTVVGSNQASLQSNNFTATRNDYDLGTGNDDFTGSGSIVDFVFGGTGSDTIRGGEGNDWLEGEEGGDLVQGDGGNDTLYLRLGHDSELDTLVGGAGSDTIVNGTGTDFLMSTFDFDDATGLVNGSGVEFINLSTRVLLGTTAGNMFDFAGARFIGANTTAANIEVSSGDGDDTIIGSSIAALQSNAFTAPQNDYDLGAGNDDFTGTGNVRDVVYGGTGNDTIRGEGGNDWFEGQAGADLMLGGLGNDTFYVRAGEQSELDHFAGGDGADIVINGVGLGFTMSFFDFDDATGLLNGSSVETIQLNSNSLNGTASGDFFDFDGTRFTAVNTTPSVFEVMSGDGNDTITGSSILAVQSNAFTATENNYDLGAGNDSFTGAGTVKDVVFGRAGNDTIAGGGGTDVLDGGADNDSLIGGLGNDTLDGGIGIDRVEGGDGDDHIVLTAGSAHETEEYLGEAGTDRIVNNTGGDFTLTMVNTSMGGNINATGIEQIALNSFRMLGTATGDNFDLGGVQFLAVSTTLAATELDTGAGNDTVIGSGLAGIQTNSFGVSQFRYELGQGNDHFTGTGTITNVVFGEDGSDTLIGGNGVDLFEGGTGADSMDGGAGNDTFTLRTLDQSELDTIVGGAGSDTIINAAGANFIMTVFDFDDGTGTVNGSGVENINLASGTLFGTSAGNMFDFVGARFVSVNTSPATLEVSAGGGNDTIFGSAILGLQSNSFTAPQNDYDLGDGNDLFIGSGTVRDVVYGGIGNDTIQGEGGHDWFEGQAGADLMLGGSGNDTFYVRAGEQSELDNFAGGDGSDIIINGVGLGFTMSFFDFDDGTGLLNGSSVETIQLNNNSLNGTASGDFFDFAGTRFTAVNTTPAVFEVMSGDGNDTITGSNIAALQSNNFTAPQIDYDLGSGADSFTGAGVIKDVVFGRAGNDTINGGDGTDVLDGGADNDSLLGGLGNDTLDGGIGVDRVEGGDGDDQIILTAGSAHETEEYLGEAGTDRIVNNTGSDFTLTMVNTSMGGNINATGIEQIAFNNHVLLGTTGNDNFDFSAIQFLALNTNLANTEVNTGAGNDTVVGSSVSGLQSNNFSTNQLRYELGEGDDLFTVSGTVSNVVFGDGGSDTINGGAGADLFEGGSGGDSMNGGAGNDTFTIRTGDQLELDTIVGGLGTDTITNLAGVNFIMSAFDFDDATETVNGSGIEQINLVSGTLFGTATGNLFDFSGTRFVGVNTSPATLEVSAGDGNDTVIGTDTTALQSNNFTAPRVDYDLGDGDDSFTGSGAGISELILGGLGNDTITGGGGSDTMTGGAGDDIFIFTPLDNATNVVTDFELDIDHIDVSALTDITDFTDLVTNHLSQSGADALISGANATAIRLTGINIALLDADDFIF
ncbi:Ig-like domain-containing protein, partial [Shimia sp. CNT1-13L.2]|uniref:Ig-like domain-containing protein n=1 Tax=Shimia sp. CNT1-13L.2 TaxID=2959663 RepID=UPI0020CE312C